MIKHSATQNFVPIKEVRDGVVILENGSLRVVLMVSSLNFSLKSIDEQEAIISQFQNFLNSLDFSIQIFIQSRKLDIRPYVAVMEERYKEQVNELIRIQTKEYIGFIKNFTDNINIMSKNFFVVVSYENVFSGAKKSFLNFGKKKSKKAKQSFSAELFEENKSQIEQRVGVVEQGLSAMGLRTAHLGTEEIIELFYKMFNPGESEKPIQLN